MDKAIILGVYEFIGFHFCQQILNEGIDVEGIHINLKSDEIFVEEKRMEIGRNANFRENDLKQWKVSSASTEEITLIVDFYDLFMRKIENQFLKLEKFQTELKSINGKIILLLPIVLLANKHFEPILTQMYELIDFLKNHEKSFQVFFLPTIYGPWQPIEFIYQRSIVEDNKNGIVSEREWTADCLYVEDIVHTILNESIDESGLILLKSKEKDRWNHGADLLGIPKKQGQEGEVNIRFSGIEKTVVDSISLKHGLENQKRNVEFLN